MAHGKMRLAIWINLLPCRVKGYEQCSATCEMSPLYPLIPSSSRLSQRKFTPTVPRAFLYATAVYRYFGTSLSLSLSPFLLWDPEINPSGSFCSLFALSIATLACILVSWANWLCACTRSWQRVHSAFARTKRCSAIVLDSILQN